MNGLVKLRFAAAFFALSCVIGGGIAAAAPATVNLSDEKQLIRGFGGMNYPGWIDDLTAAQRETAFGNGAGQLGFTILRIHVDENKNNWQREVATAKKAAELGALVFASPWNPPSEMKESFSCGNCNGADGKTTYRLRKDKYADYAKHLNDFVTFMKTNGAELYAISIQNEPDYDAGWLYWTGAEIVSFLKNNASSINCRIMAPESFQYVKSLSDPILNDAQALANMDILGAHLYGTQVSQFPYPLFKQKGAGKELWMTEVYVPNSSSDADTWPEALDVAVHIHRAMAEAEFQSYVWWYIRRSYGPMKENGTISKRGYMMAHFSKFVRHGYVRVDATKSPETDVFVSAYKSADSVVIVAVNKKTSAVNQQFTVNGGAVTKMAGKRTSGTENLVAIADVSLSNGSFTASLPARSVTTFVGATGGGGKPVAGFTLATAVSPANSGTVTKSPAPSASGSYDSSTVVKLTAAAAAGWTFDGWEGDASGAADTVYVAMSGNKSVTAKFKQPPTGVSGKARASANTLYKLTVRALPNYALNVNFTAASGGLTAVKLYDLRGNVLSAASLQTTAGNRYSHTINAGILPGGFYVVAVEGEKGAERTRAVISK